MVEVSEMEVIINHSCQMVCCWGGRKLMCRNNQVRKVWHKLKPFWRKVCVFTLTLSSLPVVSETKIVLFGKKKMKLQCEEQVGFKKV